MDLTAVIAVAGGGGTLSALALKAPEFLKEIYGDLAKPGATEVGKAIGGILGLGNTILFPLHLLNARARLTLENNFERYREKLASYPPDSIIEPAPEIAVPLMEALSRIEDKTLREMFCELLAKASSSNYCGEVHPVFVKIIGEISPDEAEFIDRLASFHVMTHNQSLLVGLVKSISNDNSYKILDEHVFVPFVDIPRGFKENSDLLVENLIRIGLFERERGAYPKREHLDKPRLESELIEEFSPKLMEGESLRIEWGALRVTPIGESFARAALLGGTSRAQDVS